MKSYINYIEADTLTQQTPIKENNKAKKLCKYKYPKTTK